MNLVDITFLILLSLIQPISGALGYRRLMTRIQCGYPADRVRQYKQVLVLEWSMFSVLLILWLINGRPFSAFKLELKMTMGFWIAFIISLLVCAYLLYSWWSTSKMDDAHKHELKKNLGNLIHFLPQSTKEYRCFCILSFTAGMVEEFVYRAYLFWCFTPFMPSWAVVIVSSLIFGFAHSYQGLRGIFKVSLIGIGAAGLFIVSNSIWIIILLHIAVDVLQGAMLKSLLTRTKA